MTLPTSELIPNDPEKLPPARRRRARRLLAPFTTDERASYIDGMAHRTSPSFDFFLFSFLSALVLVAGLILNSPPLLLLGALVAPFLGPVIGLALGTVVGSAKLFLRSAAGLLVGFILIFIIGAGAGYLSRFAPPIDLFQSYFHARLSWENLLVLIVTSIIATAALANSNHRPGLVSAARVASVGMAYEFIIPLLASGFGLGLGAPHLFPDGIVVLAVHLSWSLLFCVLTFAVLGCRPMTLFGYTFGGAVTLMGVIVVIGLSSIGAVFGAQVALPTQTPTATLTVTPSSTITTTPVPPTATRTLIPTSTQTLTPVPSPTTSPTPVYALVTSPEGGGAKLRSEPSFDPGSVITTVLNRTLVVVLPETREVDGYLWALVRLPDGREGWMLQGLLLGATPAPNW